MEIKPVHTSCHDCHFAEFEGKTQTGCTLELLEKYKAKGFEVVPAYNEDLNEFFIVNGTMCLMKRSTLWGTRHQGKEIEQLKEELSPKVEYIVYIDSDTMEDISHTLTSIESQEFKPVKITCINNSGTGSDELQALLQKMSIKWVIKEIVEQDADFGRCLDMVVKECKSRYFVACQSGDAIPEDFSTKLNHTVNVEMTPVMYVHMGENCYASQAFWYRNLFGNRGDSYQQKIQDCMKNTNFADFYHEWTS